MKGLLRSAVAAMVLVSSASVFAADPGTLTPVAPNCSTTDMTAFGATGSVGAYKCLGAYDGNIDSPEAREDAVLALIASQWGLTFTNSNIVSSGTVGAGATTGLFNGITAGITGTIGFDALANTYSGYGGDVIMGLKAGDSFSLYLFTAADLASIGGFTSMSFNTAGSGTTTNGQGQTVVNGLSHAVYIGSGGLITKPGPNPVPEAETYAMLLGGLGLIGFVARRRQKSMKVTFA